MPADKALLQRARALLTQHYGRTPPAGTLVCYISERDTEGVSDPCRSLAIAEEPVLPPRPHDGMPAHWAFFSPTAERVVDYLRRRGDDRVTGQRLARAVGRAYNPAFQALLRDLRDRGVVCATSHGYRLKEEPG